MTLLLAFGTLALSFLYAVVQTDALLAIAAATGVLAILSAFIWACVGLRRIPGGRNIAIAIVAVTLVLFCILIVLPSG